MIKLDEIPPCAHDSPEARAAFAEILMTLFTEYPVWHVKYTGADGDIHRYRKHALLALSEAPGDTLNAYGARPRQSLFMALDTGVPNDRLLAAYAMLFT